MKQDTHYDPDYTLQLKDVYGEWNKDYKNLLKPGMIVARYIDHSIDSHIRNQLLKHYSTVCPVWHDGLGYKSKTIVCDLDQESEVTHWIAYVEGGLPVERKELEDNKVALRADYQAW